MKFWTRSHLQQFQQILLRLHSCTGDGGGVVFKGFTCQVWFCSSGLDRVSLQAHCTGTLQIVWQLQINSSDVMHKVWKQPQDSWPACNNCWDILHYKLKLAWKWKKNRRTPGTYSCDLGTKQIYHSHSTTIALSSIDLTFWSRVGLIDIVYWSNIIQSFFSPVPN